MLICVIKYYDVCIMCFFSRHNGFYTSTSIRINSNMDVWEFSMHLERLIAYFCHLCISFSEYKTFTLPFVPSAQYGYLQCFVQYFDKVFYMRRLSRATNSNIAHSYDWEWIFFALDDFIVKQEATNPHSYAIKPGERFEPVVDFYVIAFHVLFYADEYWDAGLYRILILYVLHHFEWFIIYSKC